MEVTAELAEQTTCFCLTFFRFIVPANITNDAQQVLKKEPGYCLDFLFLISTPLLDTQWAFLILEAVIATLMFQNTSTLYI